MKLHLLSLLKLRVPPWDSGNNNNKVFSSWSWPLTSCSVKQMIVTSCPVSCTWQGIYWVQIVFYHAAHTAHCHAFQGGFVSLLSNQLFERFFFKVRKGHPDEHSLSFSSIISWTENWHWGRISCVTTCSVPALPKSLHVLWWSNHKTEWPWLFWCVHKNRQAQYCQRRDKLVHKENKLPKIQRH